jgi:acyl dehydratase
MAEKKSADEILEEARKFIGAETKPRKALYPVEMDPIRRFCHMTNDDNPLYLDPDYAKSSQFGTITAPMTAIGLMSGNGIWPPTPPDPEQLPTTPTLGDRAINLTTEWEFYKAVKVGDHISTSQRIADIYIKPIRLDPKAFWKVSENVYRNQDGDVVAIHRNIGLSHRTQDQVAADSG